MQIWNNIRWLQEIIYELLQNAPDKTKQASKGWIYNEDQYKRDLGRMKCQTLSWMVLRPAGTLKTLNNLTLLSKTSKYSAEDVKL